MRALLLASATASMLANTAQAAYVASVQQVGGNILVTGSGSIITSGLPSIGPMQSYYGELFPNLPLTSVGQVGAAVDAYSAQGNLAKFGSNMSFRLTTTVTGRPVSFNIGVIEVPAGYVSGSDLGVSTAEFDNVTFGDLGLTPGTYVSTFGIYATAADIDTFTVQVGSTPVPEPASLALLGMGVTCVAAMRRRRAG